MILNNLPQKILTLLILILSALVSYANNRAITEKYGDYNVSIKRDDPNCDGILCPRTLSIEKNRQKLFELNSSIIGTIYYNKTKSFLGNSKPIMLINDYSGGAHCCNTYHILDMSNNAKLIQKIEAFDSTMDVIEKTLGDPCQLSLNDTTFNYFYVPFVASPMPQIFLKFDGNQFVCDGKAMKKDYSDEEFNSMLLELDNKRDKLIQEAYFLKNVIELIYSGNAKFAWKLVDAFFKKHNFHNIKPEEFKKNVLCQLTMSRCLKAIEEINSGALIVPANCDANEMKKPFEF